jgi:tetratricopeptide (TPR) repeat protein
MPGAGREREAASAMYPQIVGAQGLTLAVVHCCEAAPFYQKAWGVFGKLIEMEPKNAGNYNNFALALATNGEVDEAKQKLAMAIEIDPADAWTYHYNLAALLMNSARLDDAIEEFRKASDAKPDFADAYYYLGSTLAGKATIDAAGKMAAPPGTLEALRKYLSLKPDGSFASTAKELLTALGAKR